MIATTKFINRHNLSKGAAFVAAAFLCFAPLNASAQISKTKTNDGAVISVTAPKASTAMPPAHPMQEESLPAGATVIYSNLGTGSSLYDPGTGWTEAGVEANDEAIAEAMAFTPDSDYILLRVDAAFTWLEGTNGAKMILAEDNAGVPGKVLYVASFTDLPVFGTCCTIQTAKLTPSKSSYVELKAGQVYWLYPLPDDTTGYIIWNYDTTNKGGTGAVSHDYGQSWTATTYPTFGAFDLYGIKLN